MGIEITLHRLTLNFRLLLDTKLSKKQPLQFQYQKTKRKDIQLHEKHQKNIFSQQTVKIFVISNHVDPTLGLMPLTPFGYTNFIIISHLVQIIT